MPDSTVGQLGGSRRPRRIPGWRCVWEHFRSRDVFTGECWDTYEDAEYIAGMLRESGFCLNVRIVRSYR